MKLPNLANARKRTKNPVEVITDNYKLTNDMKKLGLNRAYYIKTYGCQMNEHDTENIKAILEDMSFTETSKIEDADLILLNTCAIRENVHYKVFGFLGQLKSLKQQKPHVIIGLCGCMAQEEVVIEEILKKYSWLDIVFGTHNIHNLPNILERALAKKELEIEVFSNEGDIYENIPAKRESKYKAWVNIMYGCDKFCTYCIVPYTRGKQRSRLPEYIINEVKELVKEGYLEVTLLGQNVNAYGKDLDINYNMANLLEDVAKTGIKIVRFLTSHPWDFTDDMIEVIKNNSNIMPHIHLPLQSGSDKILKLMGRRYTKEDYIKLYNKLKENIPNCAITTDIIVGFPNESDEEFEDTLTLVDEAKFEAAFTFIYSPRKGTPAAKLEDHIGKETKSTRFQALVKRLEKHIEAHSDAMVGQVFDVLVDGVSKNDPNMYSGYTDENKLVHFRGDESLVGKIVKVKVHESHTYSMIGELVNG